MMTQYITGNDGEILNLPNDHIKEEQNYLELYTFLAHMPEGAGVTTLIADLSQFTLEQRQELAEIPIIVLAQTSTALHDVGLFATDDSSVKKAGQSHFQSCNP